MPIALPAALLLTLTAADSPPSADRAVALAEMVAAERSFSARAAVVGVRDAFLEYFAPDAQYFNPDLTAAVPALRAQPPSATAERKAVLEWGPTHADMAASADLGWDTGPYVVRETGGEKREIDHGYFFSIWRRQADGTLAVELDAGLSVKTGSESALTEAPAGPVPATVPAAETAKAGLQARERELLAAVGKGLRRGYEPYLAANVRLHRAGEAPIVGKAEALAWLGEQETTLSGEPVASGVSRAGDLGYVVSKLSVSRAGSAAETAWAVRVWRWAPDGWQVVFDTLLTVPPAPSSPPPAPPAPAAGG